MINIHVSIKRIHNGFIVSGLDSIKTEMFYPTLDAFFRGNLMEPIKEIDEMYRTHDEENTFLNVEIKIMNNEQPVPVNKTDRDHTHE